MDMLLYIYFCSCWVVLVAPVVFGESAINTQCTDYGDCIDNKINQDKELISNNDTIGHKYEVSDEFGNGLNISITELKILLSTLTEKQDNYNKIQKDVAFVFKGVIAAVILFGVCATLCVISACIYCCRINITDNRLKNDVEALAEKLKRECRFKKTIKKKPLEPVSQSCNIIVEDAGVFCV